MPHYPPFNFGSKRTFITHNPTIGASEGNMTYYRVGIVHIAIPKREQGHNVIGIARTKVLLLFELRKFFDKKMKKK